MVSDYDKKLLSVDRQDDMSDSWMLSYVDVFILLSTLFVMLFMISEKATKKEYDMRQKLSELKMTIKKMQATQQLPLTEDSIKNEWHALMKQMLSSIQLTDTVSMNIEDDFAQLEIQDDMLFDSGDAILKSEGRKIFDKIIPLLELSHGMIFIEGHTDNLPISTERFPSNWELGSARATNVLKYLVTKGFSTQRLRAVSYAETSPIETNETPEGRRKNRRVSLLLQVPGASLE